MKIDINLHHSWTTQIPPWVYSLNRKLDLILKKQDTLMSDFSDLQSVLGTISAGVATVKTDVDALIAKLAAIPPAGLTPEQQAALDAAVSTAQGIATSLGAIDAEVNPPAAPTA